MKPYQITASIVVYENDFNRLQKTIYSFVNTSTLNVKLYIIDNSPTDLLRDLILKLRDERIIYLFNNGKNIGYGGAHNKAMIESLEISDYHVILNPDLYFKDNVLETLFQSMENDNSIGLITPKILYPDESIQSCCKLIPTPLNLFARRFLKIKNILDNLDREYELIDSGYNRVMEIPIISGCFMFFRTKTLKEIGLFDERFFMYLEDVDLCRRVHKTKYKVIFNPNATIYHDYEKGSYKNFRLLIYHVLSSIKYFNKWGWIFDEERKQINSIARLII